ncbi:MAG: lipopolysaccharide biosynthesis protein, partial [bacterium]
VLKEMIAFSYPLVISSVSSVLLTVADRYTIRYIGGLEAMGIYSLGFKIANVLRIFIINSLNTALMPIKLQMMDKPGNKRFYSKIMTYSACAFIIILLMLSLFSTEVIKLLASNPQYWSAYQIVPVLCFAQLFEMLRRQVNFGLIVEKKTKIISSVIIIASILSIGLNIGMVYFFDVMGAATAALLVQVIFFILIYHYAQKYYPINYELKKIFIMTLMAAAIIIVAFLFINSISVWPRIAVKLLLIISFPLLLYFMNFYEPIEIKTIKDSWNQSKKHFKNKYNN